MASTFTRSCMRISRVSGFTGATPTPQLPMMTVVTPCHGEQVTSGAGGQDQAVGVDDSLRGLAVARADVPDDAVLDPERTHEAGSTGSIADARVLVHDINHERSPFSGTVRGRRHE